MMKALVPVIRLLGITDLIDTIIAGISTNHVRIALHSVSLLASSWP